MVDYIRQRPGDDHVWVNPQMFGEIAASILTAIVLYRGRAYYIVGWDDDMKMLELVAADNPLFAERWPESRIDPKSIVLIPWSREENT